jgi:RHS repeat-associated protein
MMIRRRTLSLAVILLAALGVSDDVAMSARQRDRTGGAGPTPLPGSGSTTTPLPDGRLLVVGGEGSEAAAWLWSPDQQAATPTIGRPQSPRAGHSATLLSDGTVLLVGGRNRNVLVEVPEIFNPSTGVFTSIAVVGAVPRAGHTATLLIDGEVLVVGGENGGALPLATERWDLNAHTAAQMGTTGVGRSGHTATLIADGHALINGGTSLDGTPVASAVSIDPLTGIAQAVAEPQPAFDPAVMASIPDSGATEIAVDAHVALRFSEALDVASLSPQTIALSGPDGTVPIRVIAAEGGRLVFVWPTDKLVEDTTYTVTLSGASNASGTLVVPFSMTFTTLQRPVEKPEADAEIWTPDAATMQNGWRTNRPPSPWESLDPLMAPPGVSAISGRVLTLDGRPLPDVTLTFDDGATAHSDRTGRFLLTVRSPKGRDVIAIDGATASRPGRKYGFFEWGTTVAPGRTNVLPFTIWMPRLDTKHVVTIPSPTTREVVVTTPSIPGLELHLPPGTVIRGRDGKPVTELGITAIPVDRPPFPLAKNVEVPVYFTVQPGGAYVYQTGAGPRGAQLVYPNYRHAGEPGQRVPFFHYDPEVKDWYVYGVGTVKADATQVVPDVTTRLYEFTGAMINVPGFSPPNAAEPPGASPRGDPVDPSMGLFVVHKTDLFLPDLIPLSLTRTYNSGDTLARPFGRGMLHPYTMFLWSANQYQEADLILPEGSTVHYVRTSSGTSWLDAVFEHTATPTAYYKSTIVWNGQGWNLTLKDGTVYVFGENAPLQAIKDRYGNTVTITHANGQGGNVTQVTSPNGRSISFTYDTSNRITQATDNIGRTVSYTYDSNGNLSTVTDPENQVTTYGYDTSNRMTTVTDGRNITFVTNTYTNGRVTAQTLGDPNATYHFTYTVDGSGNVTQTDVTDPRGHVERLAFNSSHYTTSDTQGYGSSFARTTTTTRDTGSNLVTATVDGLSRRTEYTYDTSGHVLTETRLAGTSDAVTTTYNYEPIFSQPATVTDPLNHTWTTTYDAAGLRTGTTDPLSHHTTIAMNPNGQVERVTDPLTHQWQFGYAGGDLTSVTNPLGAVQSRFTDTAGRLLSTTDPLGHQTMTTSDALDRTTSVTDPLGAQTTFTYDANSNLLSLTDALSHATSYTYDTSDRVATRTDPLSHASSFEYDLNGNATQTTDRKSQVTSSTYDALDRLSQVTFDDSSTISYTYDAGDRITQIADSANGTIYRMYDLLNRLTEETTPQGTVDYSYDAAGRRTSMTVAGQTAVTYGYDNGNRLTSITQGSAMVSLTYDDADRRSTLTYPNGIVATYGYDNANHLTSLTYNLGMTTLGDLAYTYDAAGWRTSVGGSWARTGIPAALTGATYDAANRIVTWGGTGFSYDSNGNLTSDGFTSYTWNARDQLVGLSGGTSASFAYDAYGRRRGKTIAESTQFLYDGLNPVQELSGGTPTANVLTGLRVDERFTRSDATGVSVHLTDALGSSIALTDGSGTPATEYSYEPYGGLLVSGSASTNTFGFTGREMDGTELYYYRARYYSPTLARFLSEDPIGFKGGWNLFAYVGDNPVVYRDPTGLLRNCDQEHIDCFRDCWKRCPPWPIENGKRGHYLYCQSKCLAEYMACEAANAAERAGEACRDNPKTCAALVLGAAAVAIQPELGPVLVPIAVKVTR